MTRRFKSRRTAVGFHYHNGRAWEVLRGRQHHAKHGQNRLAAREVGASSSSKNLNSGYKDLEESSPELDPETTIKHPQPNRSTATPSELQITKYRCQEKLPSKPLMDHRLTLVGETDKKPGKRVHTRAEHTILA